MKNIFLLSLALMLAQFGMAQQFTLVFSNPLVDNANAPTQLCVDLDIAYTASATLGYSNIVFDYDETVLSNPTINTDFLNATDSDYALSLTTRNIDQSTTNTVIDLGVIFDYLSATPLTLTGSANCSSTQKVANICFDISNANAVTDLSWVYDGDGTSTNTNINSNISSANSTSATQFDDSSASGCNLLDITIDIPNTPDSGSGVCNTVENITNVTYPSSPTAVVVQASDRIETNGTVTVSAGATVTFDAANTVVLKQGFSAANGSTFTAKIGGCTPAPLVDGDAIFATNDVVTEAYQLEVTPNPVANQATVRFYNPEEGYIAVSVYDFNGTLVETLHQQYAAQGWNNLTFFPRNLSAGLYFVTLQSNDTIKTERFVVQAD